MSGHYPDELLDSLNLDYKIAFSHPNPEQAKEFTIFIGADMPHWAKKFCNEMKKKQSRDLSFHGTGLMLERLHGIYNCTEYYEMCSRADVRAYTFGAEHFNLNSFNKMRVF